MDAQERLRYRNEMAKDIEQWAPDVAPDDAWWPLIEQVPKWFDGLLGLAGDTELGEDRRRVIRRVIKYLISPLDLRPELIYGPEGFREDLALIALAVDSLHQDPGPDILERHGLEPGAADWETIAELAQVDLDDDLRYHLRLLLTADSVAGDEDLAWTDSVEALVAPEPQPAASGHTIVFAGPGTGKTHRIEQELWRLLNEEQVPVEQLLVTTFTRKAADELRVRVHQRLREHDPATADATMQRLTINTIHGFCLGLIGRFHHHALFLKGTFTPMDETQRMLFLFRRGYELGLFPIYQEWKAMRQEEASRWAPIDLFHFYAYVGQVFDFLSEDVLRDAEEGLRHRYLQIIHGRGADSVDEKIITRFPRYWQQVQDDGFLDHSMQLAYAEALLDDPQVRRQVQETYSHVLVDEYQDTNPIQDRIFRAVVGSRGRMFAVGDDDQAIYAFRGADVRNATQFQQRWPGTKVEKLEQNRRSTAALVAQAKALIDHNRVRVPKQLSTINPQGTPPWLVKAPTKALSGKVADLLNRMRESGVIERWSDVAILFRGISKNVPVWLASLQGEGIPAQVAGDRRFLKRPVVHAFLAILKMIADEELKLTPRKRVHKPWFQAVGIDDHETMAAMIGGWHHKLHEGEYKTLLDLFYSMMRESQATAADILLPDLGRLSSFVAEAEAQLTSPEIVKRLSWFNTYAAAAADAYEGPPEEPEDTVSLMTIHKSKGLEFPVVVMADVSEGSIPADFPENLRTKLRRELAGLEPHLDPMEEERRVLYVGMTRAREYLILTTDEDAPSPFLDEFEQIPAPVDIPIVVSNAYPRKHRPEPPFHTHHSAVYNYYFCPRRYLLESRYGFAGRVIAPLRAGQSLHRALEIYHRLLLDGEKVTSERRERIFERAWLRPRSKEVAAKEREELVKVFDTYADRWEAGQRERRLKTVDVEQPFFVAEGRGVLTGRIDLIREREDRLEIVEFKYRKNRMMPEYPTRQLEHYSLAYPNEEPRLVVHYLHDNIEEEIPRRAPGPIRQDLDIVFKHIADQDFDPQPTRRTCRLCPVRSACKDAVA